MTSTNTLLPYFMGKYTLLSSTVHGREIASQPSVAVLLRGSGLVRRFADGFRPTYRTNVLSAVSVTY